MPGGDDLRQLVDESTCVKQIFSARTPEARKHISSISGEVGYYNATWQQFVFRVMQGEVTMNRALRMTNTDKLYPEHASTDISVTHGPRLTTNEIEDISRSENGCIFYCNRSKGTAQFKGAFPVHVDYPIDKNDYEARNEMSWPASGDETVEPKPFWPASVENETIRKKTPAKPETDLEELEEIHRRMNDFDSQDYFP